MFAAFYASRASNGTVTVAAQVQSSDAPSSGSTPPAGGANDAGAPPKNTAQVLGDCFAAVLNGQVTASAAGDLTRGTGHRRSYNCRKRKRRDPEPETIPKALTPIARIVDGSAFRRRRLGPPSTPTAEANNPADTDPPYCCRGECNVKWGPEALARCRSALPPYRRGTQAARKEYVRSCFTEADGQLHIRDGLNTIPVCWQFYRSLMGASFNLLRSAGSVGPVNMIKRDATNTGAQLIVAWLRDMAKNWELQPDKNEIHMSYPSATMVYNIFCSSDAWKKRLVCDAWKKRNGEYSEGYMAIMKSWPDLRDTPDHPRKVVDDHTLKQHRLCIEASERRIETYCHSVDELPEGLSANQYHQALMSELASSVIDVGKSTPVPFDWNLSLYSRPESNDDTGDGGGASGSSTHDSTDDTTRTLGVRSDPSSTVGDRIAGSAVATGDSSVPQGGGEGRRGRSRTPGPLFRVEVGEFVAFSQPSSSPVSVCVGQILSMKKGVDGDEVELQWYMPKKVVANAPRSTYGRGGWTLEFRMVDGKRVRSISFEHVAAISCKFAKLPSTTKLPHHVWPAIAETTQAQNAVEDVGDEDMHVGDDDE